MMPPFDKPAMIGLEIVGEQEKTNAAAGLVTDAGPLAVRRRFCEK